MKLRPGILALILCTVIAAVFVSNVSAEEVWLYNNTRVYGLIKGVSKDGKLKVLLPTGNMQDVPLQEIIAITFLGRNPLLIQSGTQEFRFVGGSRLRGQILGYKGDRVRIQTAMSGEVYLKLFNMQGFVSLPMSGFSSLKAEEMVAGDVPEEYRFLDMVIDRRGSLFRGVVRKLERTALHLDIDDLLQVCPFKILYLKGVRLADAARKKEKPWSGELLVCVTCRDGSLIRGTLEDIRFNRWRLKTAWNPELTLKISLDEISLVQIMGGYVQYLSQLEPAEVKESTILAPLQPYQMDRSCQKDSISIAGRRYPWGIGVHADSELTFLLHKRYKEFKSDIGISTSVGKMGSVVFQVLGDGKTLYKSDVVRGSDREPRKVTVPVEGVSKLTLKVANAGDLDLGDVANWGSARLLKFSSRKAGGKSGGSTQKTVPAGNKKKAPPSAKGNKSGKAPEKNVSRR